jgi:hypothetical protein
MATPKQIAANRANAQQSTGPQTAAGKARARRNSYKHGLLSKELLLSWEEEKDYRRLLNALVEEHQPEGATEVLLVEQMAVATWKLARLTGMETAIMTRQFNGFLQLSHKTDPAKSTAEKFQYALSNTLPKNLQALLNYESLLSKGFHRALNTLTSMQQRRMDVIDGEATEVIADSASETPQDE